ncbi:MAG: hypothetical protein JWN74_2177 [Acidobacteriaceae bacterium]|nr:hypothetical protein [Acidobacteriaceae bacterium]
MVQKVAHCFSALPVEFLVAAGGKCKTAVLHDYDRFKRTFTNPIEAALIHCFVRKMLGDAIVIQEAAPR